MFYESLGGSAIPSAVIYLGSRLRVADADRLNKLICGASSVGGVELDSLEVVSEKRMLSKPRTVLENPSHPLQRKSFIQWLSSFTTPPSDSIL